MYLRMQMSCKTMLDAQTNTRWQIYTTAPATINSIISVLELNSERRDILGDGWKKHILIHLMMPWHLAQRDKNTNTHRNTNTPTNVTVFTRKVISERTLAPCQSSSRFWARKSRIKMHWLPGFLWLNSESGSVRTLRQSPRMLFGTTRDSAARRYSMYPTTPVDRVDKGPKLI